MLSSSRFGNIKTSFGKGNPYIAPKWPRPYEIQRFVEFSGQGYLQELKKIVEKVGLSKAKTLAQTIFTTNSRGPESNISGRTPLFNAVCNSQLDVIQYLVQVLDAHLDVKCHGQTPLHVALLGKSEPVVRLLLELGANPQIQDKKGQTAIELAKKLGLTHLFK